MGTGEGKSLILAVVSCVLALMGIDVKCACYSEYLSSRDYEAFLPIFNDLGVTEQIYYGTFNKICESIINEDGDIRNNVIDLVANETRSEELSGKTQRPKILLIDEVDVFFSDFYGSLYTPLARLKDPTILNLINYIWTHRQEKLSAKFLETTAEYEACRVRFSHWDFLIKEAIKDMIADVDNFKHVYLIQDDKIGYKEQDGISFDVVYGYKTMFAYFHEHDLNKISQSSLEENIFIAIKCGSFSYAEIPECFQFIMGVTGTLKTLSKSERHIVEDVYNITKKTFIPSVFGENKRRFAKQADVYVENRENYFISLRERIDYALGGNSKSKRAVMVFFESKKVLMDFYESSNLAPIKADVQIITEEISSSPKEKDMLIKRATSSGQITLLTSVFGRGTDFVCRDHNVISNGGVHVIQTFFSEELSEEIQIMGRTARQGKDGSYSMVLLEDDLEKYLGTSYRDEIERMRTMCRTYDTLNEKRNAFFEQKYANISEGVAEAKREHMFGKQFVQAIRHNELTYIKRFLGERNVGATGFTDSRTICLMDATGSMSHLLNQAKTTVGTMFERASLILTEHGIPTDSFQMQFAVYRDYDCMKDGILQYSPWETKPENLRKFMETVSAHGGGDYEEAIEIALWHANNEHEKSEVSQVLLIGDAPSKKKNQISAYRKTYGGEAYWLNSEFKASTHYLNEVAKLKAKNIPVHAFYLDNGAKLNFEEISAATGGKSEFLKINSAAGSDRLTNLVTEKILNSVGQARGKGDELVQAYRKKFTKAYK